MARWLGRARIERYLGRLTQAVKTEDPGGLDLTGVIVGSEGTFGLVTEVTVRLTRNPAAFRTLLGVFETVDDATQTVSDIIAAGTVIPENTVVEPYSLWMGVPGKFRKKTDDDKTQQMILQYAKNYLDYTAQYLRESKM